MISVRPFINSRLAFPFLAALQILFFSCLYGANAQNQNNKTPAQPDIKPFVELGDSATHVNSNEVDALHFNGNNNQVYVIFSNGTTISLRLIDTSTAISKIKSSITTNKIFISAGKKQGQPVYIDVSKVNAVRINPGFKHQIDIILESGVRLYVDSASSNPYDLIKRISSLR